MKTLLKIIFSLMAYTCFFSSCTKQKGCTDKDAINFNATASEDDGSCIVCKTVETLIDSEKVYLKDKRSGSPHYNENVARFSIYQYVETPNDRVCGKENCKLTLTVKNLINQNMYFTYYITRFSGPLSIYYNNDIDISINELINVGKVTSFNNPPFFHVSSDSISIVTNSDIIYY